MHRAIKVTIPILLTVIMACSNAVHGEVLKLKYKPGEVLKYAGKASTVIRIQGAVGAMTEAEQQMQMNINVIQKIIKVDEHGNYVIRLSISGTAKITLAQGQTQTMKTPASEVEIVMTPFGKVLKSKAIKAMKPGVGGPGGMMPGMRNIGGFDLTRLAYIATGFPERDVKPGDSWDIKNVVKLSDTESITVTGKAKFIGIERKGNFLCAVLEIQQSGPSFTELLLKKMGLEGVSGRYTMRTKMWFAIAEGRIVYQQGRYDEVIAMSLGLPGVEGEEMKLTTIAATNFVMGLVEQE